MNDDFDIVKVPGIVFFGDNPDEKEYLLLLKYYPEDETKDAYKDWTISVGRQDTYNKLRELVKNELIDPCESFIIAGETDALSNDDVIYNSNPITVFRFMNVMLEQDKVLNDDESFDIFDYYSQLPNLEDKKIKDC